MRASVRLMRAGNLSVSITWVAARLFSCEVVSAFSAVNPPPPHDADATDQSIGLLTEYVALTAATREYAPPTMPSFAVSRSPFDTDSSNELPFRSLYWCALPVSPMNFRYVYRRSALSTLCCAL